MEGISKSFSSNDILANSDVSIDLDYGEIHGVVGENGAGKTTLMNILSGRIPVDTGTIRLHGKQININSPKDALAYGIGIVNQHPLFIPEFSVMENIMIGWEPKGILSIDRKRVREMIETARAEYSIHLDLNVPVYALSSNQLRNISILALIIREPHILIFDEPTSSFTDQEVTEFFRLITSLKNRGKGIFFITHKLREVMEICDRVTVLRRGRRVTTRHTGEVDTSTIAEFMLGSEATVERRIPFRQHDVSTTQKTAPLLRVENVSADISSFHMLRHIEFTVYPKEVVAVTGIRGFGLETLEEILSGNRAPTSGRLIVNGQQMNHFCPKAFRDAGIGYIPTDRLNRGCSLQSTVSENLSLLSLDRFHTCGVLQKKRIREYADDRIREFSIAASAQQRLEELSGGNIQKVIISRELGEKPTILIFSEPSLGLDTPTLQDVYRKLETIRSGGAGIIMISSNIDEVLELADRIVVLFQGTVAAIVRNRNLDNRRIGEYMLGLQRDNNP